VQQNRVQTLKNKDKYDRNFEIESLLFRYGK
jgi:hypothetical protein